MTSILGIDIGTSSIKAMLLDINEGVIGTESKDYDVMIPKLNYAEQDPELWWESLLDVLKRLKEKYTVSYKNIQSIGFSGQMHGLVVVDKDGNSIRPAILWNDQRSEVECQRLKEIIGKKDMREILHNRIFTGFSCASLLWLKEHEPDNFQKIDKIMQPKDYIRYKMTGIIGAEVSDASATLMFDIGKRDWAWAIIQKCGFPTNIFPKCHESTTVQGTITRECSLKTGISETAKAVYGMGDQQAQSIGNGAIREGLIVSNIGTGAQISTYSNTDNYDRELRIHTFCHGFNKAYTIYGAILNGGMSLKWLKNNVLHDESFEHMSELATEVEPGSDGMIYLPYLTGERTPHMNPNAKAVFFGMQLGHEEKHFARAVMEGVTFALKDSLEIFDEMGIKSEKIIASGGGSASHIWLQIQADIFNKEVMVCQVSEQACLGACIGAGVGCGLIGSVEEGCDRFVEYSERTYFPQKDVVKKYGLYYERFKQLYRCTECLL